MRTITMLILCLWSVGCSSSPKPEEKAPAARSPVEVPAKFQVRFDTTKGPFTVEVVREEEGWKLNAQELFW